MYKAILLCITILSFNFVSCQNQAPKEEVVPEKILKSELINYQYLIDKNDRYAPAIETYKIRYESDGLEITGYVLKPEQVEGKLPVIIFNRGGNRDFGTIDRKHLHIMADLSARGYIVLASQYRGNLFSEGEDEFGGKDVNDVLRLIDIAKTLSFADSENIGVLGYSRGGLMAYLLSRKTDDIKAIAVVGAPTDVLLNCKNRPEMYEKVFHPLVGDSIQYRSSYIDRSPAFWADEINEPVLILHGTNDWRVHVEHANKMIDALHSADGKVVEYKIFEGGDHALKNYKTERENLLNAWFEKYLKSDEG